MVNFIYLFTCAAAYVQSSDYYYDRIAVNARDNGYSMMFLDGVSERDGRLTSCIDGQCHALSSDVSENLKARAIDQAAPGEVQYWYTEGLAAFLNNQSMLHKREVTPLFTVTHNDGGASIKWESTTIRTRQVGNDTLIVGPDANYTLSDPSELLQLTYQSGQYVQSSKVAKRYDHRSTILAIQEYIKNDVPYADVVATASFLLELGTGIVEWKGNSRKKSDRSVLSLGAEGYVAVINGDSHDDFNLQCFQHEADNFGPKVGLYPGAMCGRVFTQNKERAWTFIMGKDFNGVNGADCMGYDIQEWEYSTC